jgi:hypothetical protein
MAARFYFNGTIFTNSGRVDFPVLALHRGEYHKPAVWHSQSVNDSMAFKSNFGLIQTQVPATIAVPQVFAMMFSTGGEYEKITINGFAGDPWGTGESVTLILRNVTVGKSIIVDGSDFPQPKPQKESVTRKFGPGALDRALRVTLLVEDSETG